MPSSHIEIYRAESSRRRECLYYLALGHYKMGNFEEARRFNGLSPLIIVTSTYSYFSINSFSPINREGANQYASSKPCFSDRRRRYTRFVYFLPVLGPNSHFHPQKATLVWQLREEQLQLVQSWSAVSYGEQPANNSSVDK